MSAPTLKTFTSEIGKRNIARQNLYYVEIVPPPSMVSYGKDSNLVSLFCSGAHTPHTYLLTNDNHTENGVRRKFAYDIDHQNLVLNFYVDQQFKVKQFFDEWKRKTVPYERRFSYPDDYTADQINVYILNQEDNVTYKYEYSRVFPKTINSIELSYSSTQISALNIEFVFEDVYFTTFEGTESAFTSKPTVTAESVRQQITNFERTLTLNPKSRN